MRGIIYLILFSITCLAQNVIAQEIYKNEKYGFSVERPEGWAILNHKDINVGLKKSHGQQLITYYKNTDNIDEQINPTIITFVAANRFKNINEFNKKMTIRRFNKSLTNYNVKKKPELINIGDKYGAFEIATYTIINKKNDYLKVRRRSYAFPTKDYIFYISFVDERDSEEHTNLFETFVKSIKITK
ncbi:hypothetical protein FA048_19460 [Pedobacter polaris]|uniref:PsbP C-terminal domain-containing protein n=1 Tax=Pedobacter polaris TaxID=2571273 RepID=A0A4U1CIR1_9SPHI|nr:hypothetical protein [Pedobacter polaris]TKC04640.1 hypothetical protein FA048_19460 [Pedobacter polaris]